MALESPVQRDGDAGFLGFASRLNPLTLPAGMLQDSVNMRLDRGVAQTRRGAKRLADAISTADEPLTLSFNLAADKAITSITFSSTTATVTTAAAHGYTNGQTVNIRGATGADATKYNGDFAIAGASGSTFTYTMTGTPAANATGTLRANAGPIVKTTYGGGIFGAGVFASRNYDNANEYVVMAGPSSAFLWRNTSPTDTVVTVGYPSSPDETIDPQDTVSVVQAYDRLYILREAPIDPTTTFKQQFTNASGITVSGTTATVNVNTHGLSAGQRVRIEGSTVAAFDGHEFDILGGADAPTTNTFKVTVPSGTANAAVANIKVRRVKPPIYWTGSGSFVRAAGGVPAEGPTYKRMRSVGWASYIQNRLIIPDGRDQVAISDYLDADLYDPFWQSFRTGAGGGDFTAVAKLELVTDEIGCSARNSIVTAGRFVFFLSDAGVYRLDTQLDLKLRGDTKPLSDPVADLFERIDQSKVQRAFGIWHSNRYILAVPTLDSPDDTNDLVVTWSALNDQWESRDIYGIGVDALVVGTYSNVRRIFNVRRTGKLYLLDENNNGKDDEPSGSLQAQVTGTIKTRRYNMGSMSSKRYVRSLADVVLPDDGSIVVKANLINPDATITLVPGQTNTSG
ncbi:MAG: hypothetical protein EBR82_45420, partial [Caulobacteraceae bacterium]|nr:hypothetical protein [Caulobacteraceae bacterium]